MKISKIIITSLLFFLMACDYEEEIHIKKGQPGGLYEISETGKSYSFYEGNESIKVNTASLIPLSQFSNVIRQKQDDESGFYTLRFKLNPEGTKKFAEMTQRNLNKSVCLIVKDKIIIAPIVNSPITNGEVSLTMGSQDALEELISYLEY